MHEAVPKATGEGLTKLRRELAASTMGEAVPEALLPAAGGKPLKPIIGSVVVIIRDVGQTRRDTAIARSIVGAGCAGVLGDRRRHSC